METTRALSSDNEQSKSVVGLAAIRPMLTAARNPLTWIKENQVDYRRSWIGLGSHRSASLISSLTEDAQHVLQRNYRNYRKGRSYEGLRETLGQGLVTSEGEHWHRQRKLIQPVFHNRHLGSFIPSMEAVVRDAIKDWSGKQFDLQEQMLLLTMRIIATTMFGKTHLADPNKLSDAVTHMTEFSLRTVFPQMPLWVPTRKNIRGKRAVAYLNRVLRDVIAERRSTQVTQDDLLGRLLDARSEDSPTTMSDQQLRDELITIFSAGHETTALALTWLWQLLDQHPRIADKVAEEATILADGPLDQDSLAQLHYTERVIKEAMRLYPPAWAIGRQAIERDQLGPETLEAGGNIIIPVYMLHRNPAHWNRPEVFDPEHFAPDAVKARPRFAYLPFGAGPRICVGAGFAMQEMKIVVALVAQRFRLRNLRSSLATPHGGITLRPKGRITVRVTCR